MTSFNAGCCVVVVVVVVVVVAVGTAET